MARAKTNRAARRREKGCGPRVGLSRKEVQRLKRRLRGSDGDGNRWQPLEPDGTVRTFAPSEPWIDASFPVFHDTSPDGKPITYQFYNPGAMPPGFVRCYRCGHANPPQCVSARGVCLDCQYGSMSPAQLENMPGSASAVSLKKIRASRRRGESAANFSA